MYLLTEYIDTGYSVLHECGNGCGAVHREVDTDKVNRRLHCIAGGGLLGIFSSQIPNRYRKDFSLRTYGCGAGLRLIPLI